MLPNRETLLCRYRYDALDRLVDWTPTVQGTARRFYLNDRLATEIQGTVQHSIMQHGDQLLAQQQRQSAVVETRLLATEQQRSVLNVIDATRLQPIAYSPYGHRPAENGLLRLPGFNGEQPDTVTGWYLLGNGYRAFNPTLLRFNSPDSGRFSPFGKGGINAYVYCAGDPVNRRDDTGHVWTFLRKLAGRFVRTSDETPLLGTLADPPTFAAKQTKQKMKAIKETIARNETKLSRAEDKLNKLKKDSDSLVRKALQRNFDEMDGVSRDDYKLLVKEAIAKRTSKLEAKVNHYSDKLSRLNAEQLEIRISKANR